MAESFVMMALGEFRFSLDTAAYDHLERNHNWRWPTIERIGSKSAAQFVGEGDETLRMSGTIYPHFRGGIGQVDAMRAQAAVGKPMRLVDGTGVDWGLYAITEVSETQTVLFSNGTPRRIDFDISLIGYGGDAEEAKAALEAPTTDTSQSAQAASPQAPAPAGPAPGRSGGGRSRESLEMEAATKRDNSTFDSQTVYEAAGY